MNQNPFEIDKNRLDEEWVNHVRDYYREATALADARMDYNIKKTTLEVVEAEIDAEIRSDPASFNLPEKLTEKMISNTIILEKRHKRAAYEEIKAKHRVNLLEALVNTLENRKRALEKLVDLRLAEYFSEPKMPKADRERMEEAQKREIRNRSKKRVRDDE